MKTIKDHWRAMSVMGVVLAIAVVWAWQQLGQRSAQAMQSPPPALTSVEYSAVVKLLDELSLDRDALVALNLSELQGPAVLSAVRTWYETNAVTLQTLLDNIGERKLAVRNIELAIAMGPYNAEHAGDLAAARQDLATAQAAYQSALAPLRQTVSGELSGSQRDTWTAIQSGHGQSMPIRMLGLNDEQRVAVSKAWRRYRYTHAAAGDAQARAAAVSAWQSELNSILTAPQQSVVSAYYSNYESASQVVAEAWAAELAVQQGEG